MSSVEDIVTSLIINGATSVVFICAYAVLKNQPVNTRVYFAKWVKIGARDAAPQVPTPRGRYINLDIKSYGHIMDWIITSLKMPEAELIRHAGLDSAIYLRMLLLGIQIFLPMMAYSFAVLVPINVTDTELQNEQREYSRFTYSSLDTITISNVQDKSSRLWAHIVAAYLYTAWTCWSLYRLYRAVADMRFTYLALQERRPDEFTAEIMSVISLASVTLRALSAWLATWSLVRSPVSRWAVFVFELLIFEVLCRCIPKDTDKPFQDQVDTFFHVNHPDYYLSSSVVYNARTLSKLVAKKESHLNKITHCENKIAYFEGVISRASSSSPRRRRTKKKGFLGLWGERVDHVEYYAKEVEELNEKVDVLTKEVAELTEKIRNERMRVLGDKNSVMPAAFVSFKNTWAAAVCSQTVQSKDTSKWLTEWAPQPLDVFWANLPTPYIQLNARRLISFAMLVALILFFLIPVAFVQSLANLDKIERNLPFLRPFIRVGLVKSILQGFLPGLSLKIFLIILPHIVWYLAAFEGHVSYSKIEKHACMNYLAFMLVNVFLGNVVAGSAFEQLKLFINTPTEIPRVLGNSIAQRATFFITYILVDGWTNTAAELIRTFPFFLYHFRNATLVRTEMDRNKATPVGSIRYTVALPRLGFFFLLGFVYSTISPLILPFILVYLAAAYLVYRNQIINVYHQKYESSGSYWPVMFTYVIIGLLVMHFTLIGVMALKKAALSTPFLVPLPFCTILFWYYCKSRFEEGFHTYPLEEAKARDTIKLERDPSFDTKKFLGNSYLHPALRAALTGDGNMDEEDSESAVDELLHRSSLGRLSRQNSDDGSSSPGSHTEKRLLPSESTTPMLSRSSSAHRPKPSGSSTPNREMSSGSSTPIHQSSIGNIQGSLPGGKKSSRAPV